MSVETGRQDPRALLEQKLDFLRAEQAKSADPEQKFNLIKAIEETKARLAELDGEAERKGLRSTESGAGPRIDLTHLPAGAQHFLGRGAELAALDDAWADGGHTASMVSVVELIAPGGTGKTALVKRWVDGVRDSGWGGAARVYGWSFYSQGTGDDRQASEDHFLAAALDWFGVAIEPSLNPADKGWHLAQAVAGSRTLLILDGLEPLQYPPGPLAGELRAPGLKALLGHLASAGQPGLCVLTSRERVQDLGEWVRADDHPTGAVLRLDLGNLSDPDGAQLLHALGANRAGAAAVQPDDAELREASREVRGHALTLSLLGGYLSLAQGGDIRRRDLIDLAAASAETDRGRAFRVMAAYETWFAREGEASARELAALRLFGFFDRPASPEDLAALRAAPAIPGLTEPLFAKPRGWLARFRRPTEPIPAAAWSAVLTRLERIGLVYPPNPDGGRDAHPLVREYLAEALGTRAPAAWREGHRRIYERLKGSVPPRPEGLAALQPLYQAVAHGCLAGLWEEARTEVYRDRILRGTGDDGFYSWRKLGAFGANLGALACLFAEPWTRPAPALTEPDQAWLLNEAAFSLRALGRLGEALGPMRAGAEMYVKQEEWEYAARVYGNLSELQLSLGLVAEAVADAGRSVDHADRSGDAGMRMINRTILADALHQQGETGPAADRFAEAEAMQAQRQPQYPLLYSLQGFRYCDLLLAGAERAAWAQPCGSAARGAMTSATAPGGAVLGAMTPAAARGSAALGAMTPGTEPAGEDPSRRGRRSHFDGPPAPEWCGGGPADATATWIEDCEAVARRAVQTLEWAEANNLSLLTIALDHLTLARCALYADLLQGRPPGPEAQAQTGQAVTGLRAAGRQDDLPRGLLTRAWLRHCLGDGAGARADLAEVERIASRGAMALHLADLHLHRARLFGDPAALAQARHLIEAHGYRRRLPELADAEAAAWPAAPGPATDGA